MPSHDEQLFQRWGHSFEEDHDDVRVYRPADFDFPRARGRAGIEFHPDGSYTDWVVGAGDAPRAVDGHWRRGGDRTFQVTTPDGDERVVEVVEVAPDRLELRMKGTS